MRTLHIVSHTHWDREWYLTFQQFRLRLVHLVDGLLDLLERDRNFKYFMLDGQTIVLDDYLAMRPENEKILRDHIRKNRILIGPWHILPDMFLVSPEAHIRNLLEGDKTARRFGPKMMVGYMPDSFGHFGQMPQLVRGFGIDTISLWRGPDDQPLEFWWDAPDGSRVLMCYLRDSYSNGASLSASVPAEFAAQLVRAADSLAANSEVSDYLIMFGTDHMEPSPDTSTAIAYANAALRATKVIHSTLPRYVQAVKSQIAKDQIHLPSYTGEFRSSKNSHLLPGVLSTRIWIKQRNQACETLLEKWLEPFSTFASLISGPTGDRISRLRVPSPIIRQTWRLLMECHPHDSICGCSIDQVHDEMKARFDQVEQIAEEIVQQSLEALAESVDTRSTHSAAQAAIVVFNPTSGPRSDLISLNLSLSDGFHNFEILDEKGHILPYQTASGKTRELINFGVRRDQIDGLLSMVHEGRVGNMLVQDIRFVRQQDVVHVEAMIADTGSPNLKAWTEGRKTLQTYIEDPAVKSFHLLAHSPESANITFSARNVPALGYLTYSVRGKERVPPSHYITPLMRMIAQLAASPFVQKVQSHFIQAIQPSRDRIENEFFIVAVKTDGTLSLTDKRDKTRYTGLNRFVDGGDCGDEYNYCPPATDHQVAARLKSVRVKSGAVLQTLELDLLMRIPTGLVSDRRSRSKNLVNLPITTRITLAAGLARVDIQSRVDNRAGDHRLRVHFPAPFATSSADYDGQFEIVNRKIGLPPFDQTWREPPRPEVPQRAFTDVSDGQHGMMLANRGLPEVETLKRSDGTAEIALTLLRCVGWLSRDDFPARDGHAGPFLPTPAAQMPGSWTFDYSIIPHAGGWKNAFESAYQFVVPMRARRTDVHHGRLPSSSSLVEVSPNSFCITAIKMSEDDRGWLMRGVNLTDEKITVSVKPWHIHKTVQQVNLAEQKLKSLKPSSNGKVTFPARGHEIVTIKFLA
jgi:mannosylglycerate hydrolase